MLACYSLLTLWLLWPYPLRSAAVVAERSDPIHQLWTLRWTQHALTHDPANLFAANVNYPYDAALTLNQPTYINAVLTLPVYALTRNQVLTYNVGVLLSFVLSGAFTALLVGRLTGSRWAALAGGALYAFAPVRQAHLAHLNLLSGYWTPLALWGLHTLWSREGAAPRQGDKETRGQADKQTDLARHQSSVVGGRWSVVGGWWSVVVALIVGAAIAAQALAEFYHAVYLALALLLFLLWQCVARRWGLTARGTALLALAGLLALLLMLPVLLPTVRAWSALDLRRPAADHDTYSARLENYLATDRPMRLGAPLSRFNHHSDTSGGVEHSLYPGLLALPLALAGLIWAFRRGDRNAPLYLLIALAALYLSLGPTIRLGEGHAGIASPPYRWLYAYVPGFQGARVPSRWGLLVQFALAVLAGYGVAALVALRPGRWWAGAVGALAILVTALDFWGPPINGTKALIADPPPRIYQALAAQPPGALLEYPLVNRDEVLSYRYEYFSTFHWRPIVNSGSSIVPPAYIDIRDTLTRFPDASAVALLRALDVRYVVVHRYEMSGWAAWWPRVLNTPGIRVLKQVADTGDALLAIDPLGPPAALSAERWSDAGGQMNVIFEASAPAVIDRAHLYERRRRMPVGLERADGSVETVEAVLPTYLLGGVVALPWADLPADVVAIHPLDGPARIPLSAPPQAARAAPGAQLVGRALPREVRAGAALPCLLYGKGPLPTAGLVLSLALVDASGQPRVKQDRFFEEGFAPPDRWPARGLEPVPCGLSLPPDLPPGRYTFSVGLYDPASSTFVPFADPDGNVVPHWDRPIDVVSAR